MARKETILPELLGSTNTTTPRRGTEMVLPSLLSFEVMDGLKATLLLPFSASCRRLTATRLDSQDGLNSLLCVGLMFADMSAAVRFSR